MERLTKREISGITYNNSPGFMCSCYCDNCSKGTGDCDRLKAMVNHLAEFEDLEEHGLLVRLPCKIGEKVYIPRCIEECKYDFECPFEDFEEQSKCCEDQPCENAYKVYKIIEPAFELKMLANIGTRIFLTREEAEAKLKEMRDGESD